MKLTEICHSIIKEYVSKPAREIFALDATCGNGLDTLFLSGISKKVFAFDIQQYAVLRSKELLAKNACMDKVEFFNASHENMSQYLGDEYLGKINVAMFNLGYLPSGDKKIITNSKSTLSALNTLEKFLDKNFFVLTILCYRGHAGGEDEYQAVLGFLRNKKFEKYCDAQNEKSPVLFVVKANQKV